MDEASTAIAWTPLIQEARRRVASLAEDRALMLTIGEGSETFSPVAQSPAIIVAPVVALAVEQPELVQPNTRMSLDGRDSLVWVDSGSTLIHCNFIMRGRNNIVVIGKDCRLKQLTIEIKGDSNIVAIGRNVTVEHAAVFCGRSGAHVLIGDDCMISSNVTMRTNDGHGIFDAATKELLNEPRDVTVHAHVWLGNGARLNKGSVVGSGAVIGQLSVLSGHAEANSIYAGIPARKIRSGIVWSRTEKFEDIPESFQPCPMDGVSG